jgi:ABC-type uncharacterized transport system permease subunit
MTLEQFAVFVGSSLRLATPLLFGATGEIVSEKAGVLNMSVEGMMLTAAFGGAYGSLVSGSAAVGLVIGVASVVPVALLQAFLSNTLRSTRSSAALASTSWHWARPRWLTARYSAPGRANSLTALAHGCHRFWGKFR